MCFTAFRASVDAGPKKCVANRLSVRSSRSGTVLRLERAGSEDSTSTCDISLTNVADIRVLMRACDRISQSSSRAIRLACVNGRLDVAKWLVSDCGLDVNVKNDVSFEFFVA